MKAKVKATGKIVDGILIYYGSEGKGYLDVPVDHDIFDRYDLEEVELLEQPPLPDGLEEAAEVKYTTCWKKYPNDGIVRSEEYYDANARERDAFKAGAEWMKAKMLEEAVEGVARPDDCEIWVNLVGYGYKFKDGDKVKVIVIKEDEI